MRKMILLLLMSILTLALPAQVKVSDHLSNPKVNCFAQDHHGRIWIGTSRGLNRYNGYDFHQYLGGELPGNEILDILCDSQGTVWVATDNGIASYKESQGFQTYEIESRMNKVVQVLEAPGGRIFLNLTEDLCVLDPISGTFRKATLFFDRYLQYHEKCYITPDGLLWAVGAAEIRCFDTTTLQNPDNLPTPVEALVSEMFPASGNILFGSRRDLQIYQTRTGICIPLQGFVLPEDIELIERINGNEAVLKTIGGALFLYNDEKKSVVPYNFHTDTNLNLTALFPDRDGNLWLGSSDSGFEVLYADKGQFNTNPALVEPMEGKSISSMDIDSAGNIWILTSSDELFLYNASRNNVIAIIPEGAEKDRTNDMLQSNPGRLFVDSCNHIWLVYSNRRQIYECVYKEKRLQILNTYRTYYPYCFAQDAAGRVWAGLRNESIVRLGNSETLPLQVFPWNNTEVRSICVVDDRLLVAAYNDHLVWVDSNNGSVSHAVLSEGSEKLVSRSGLFDPSTMFYDGKSVWIGTRNSGLLKYDLARGVITKIPSVTCEFISAIEMDKSGKLWVSTADGLFTLDRETLGARALSSINGIGGNCFNEHASIRCADGRIVFGGTHGLTEVQPLWEKPAVSSDFIFEDLSFGQDQHIDISKINSIRLTHKQNTFSARFTQVEMTGGVRPRYLVRLDGYDSDWIDMGDTRQVLYSNLNPGHYTLCVKNSDDGEIHRFKIRIKPQFFASWWMITLYCLMALAIAAVIVRTRVRIREERQAARMANAEKELEKRHSEVNMRFFANISHEFRTPLTMISGPAEQLRSSDNLNENQKGLLGTMQRNIDRMLALVNQMLDLGKLENDTLKLQVCELDIVPLVRLICEPFRMNLRNSDVSLTILFSHESIPAMTDEDKLQKILNNLLSNASKYVPRGGEVIVDVKLDGQMVKISVADNGPGIPEDKLEKIFERYYRIESGSASGTGIGLYYARALARVHHGTLQAGNRAEGGAEFTLSLPALADAYSEEEIKPVVYDGPVESVPALVENPVVGEEDTRSCVLVIDDDRELLHYLESLLSSRYRVVACENAFDGLEQARHCFPDLILSDVMMPGKSGLDFCREIKDDLLLSHIPVILVTAKGAVDNQVEGLEHGADAYVTKPFSPNYLLALIKAQIEKHQRIRNMINASSESEHVDYGDLSAKDTFFLKELYERMDKVLDQEWSDIADFAEQMGVSRSKFYYKIKALTGKTPSEFFMQYRLNVAARLLKEGKQNVSEIAFSVGFSTLPHFSKCFKKQFGVSPSKYC